MEERWDESKKYFMDYLPSQKDFSNSTERNKRYQQIKGEFLKEKFVLVQMAFVIDVASPFTKFLLLFQSEEPLVHILFNEMKALLLTMMKRFLKAEVVDKLSGRELLSVDVKEKENQLEEGKMVVGAKTERLLKKLSPFDEKRERRLMKEFYIAVITYLQNKFPLNDKLLIAAGSLHPLNRKKKSTLKSIELLAKSFPHFFLSKHIFEI